ncbi:MAG: hypothetical protein PW790_07390 [Parvibaculaceae bacterium]|nr:hypothetical protein [Parvibaculaceae bacterium]
MLTKADDFPIHQTPEPIAFAGTDRNFYDRYFFNGYNSEGDTFFAVAFGVYPHLNIMDGSFCVVHDGVQRNLHGSRWLNMERLDTQVGPIQIEVVEPLHALRVRIGDNPHGLKADLLFRSRALPIKEPRFTWRNGPRTLMDITRLTQNGTYEGWIEIDGKRIEITPDRFVGTRDRSWGVRPIGSPDAQPMAPAMPQQFYWLWAPLNFEDRITLYHVNDDADGLAWNQAGVMAGLGDAEPEHIAKAWSELKFKSGSRHATGATIHFQHQAGGESSIRLTPQWTFYMQGLGYGNPEWGHGMHKGELVVGYDEFKTADIKNCIPPNLHIQAFTKAELTLPDGSVRNGFGVLEQLIIGPHKPSGFKEVLDMAP